ncbi:A-kinase anchor protein 14 isoform X1 [Podarcis raffonei]|uniref:A-kinase anchoring protein 14 n=1 Tax=Podarcis muralis TaxID=64176 RepID=A0A670K0T3_PODMU|nr:A-kinase anchor protein 14 isoform X1 [Podarcis muralis]XP_028571557.1 A-kinase anchor protein 14 isoform X1 [Podarcis muralis]XP_053230627.1 A-kinase anchor protein 14 isoform X1 [Podarcis raffonei]XP_053230628.1 A-kinase anchor protein 14 isoform X1 [Podarcis raffonei]
MEELTSNVEGKDAPVKAVDASMEAEDPALEAIRKAAESIVKNVIRDAIYTIRHLQKTEAVPGIKYPVPNITWMKCKDFTVFNGLAQIEDYLKTWELHESWLHWTNYISEEELEYSTRYFYRVRWSIPTCRKPIPRATACVYFVIEISKIRPSTLPVEVFFVVETNKLIHRPGESRFKEKWLKDVIESKIIMMETITF